MVPLTAQLTEPDTHTEERADDEFRQEIENVEGNGIFASTAVYLGSFEREPFLEVATVNGQEITRLFHNPVQTELLIRELALSNIPRERIEEKKERYTVPTILLLNLIRGIREDLQTRRFLDDGWLTEDELQEIEQLEEHLDDLRNGTSTLTFDYPLSKILQTYSDTIREEHSLALLAYRSDRGETMWTRLTEDQDIPLSAVPRAIARIRSINHPDSTKVDLHQAIREEIGFYLSEEQVARVLETIPHEAHVWFIGEVAKIPADDRSLNPTLKAGKKLLRMVGGIKALRKRDLYHVPDWFLYITITGTSMSREGHENRMLSILAGFLKLADIHVHDHTIEFPLADNQSIMVGRVEVSM